MRKDWDFFSPETSPDRFDWLWAGKVPRGKLVILKGDCDSLNEAAALLAAKVTRGGLWPDYAIVWDRGAVRVVAAAETGRAFYPRFKARNGDSNRLHFLPGPLDLWSGMAQLTRHTIVHPDLKLVLMMDYVACPSRLRELRTAFKLYEGLASMTRASIVFLDASSLIAPGTFADALAGIPHRILDSRQLLVETQSAGKRQGAAPVAS